MFPLLARGTAPSVSLGNRAPLQILVKAFPAVPDKRLHKEKENDKRHRQQHLCESGLFAAATAADSTAAGKTESTGTSGHGDIEPAGQSRVGSGSRQSLKTQVIGRPCGVSGP